MCRYGAWEGWFSVCCSVSCPYNRDLCLQRHLYTFSVCGNLSLWIYLLSCEGQLSVGGSPTTPPHMRDFFLDCCWICGPTPGFSKASAKLNWFASDFTLLCCFQYFITILLEYHEKPSPHCPVWPWLTQILSIEPENTLRQQRTAADTLCIDSVCLLFQIATYRVSTEREEGGTFAAGEQLLTTAKRYIS